MQSTWKDKVAEEMFAMTTCIQTGEELAIPDIWHSVMVERDSLREDIERMKEEYLTAAELVATLYEAVMHTNHDGPIVGVVEDVENRIKELESAASYDKGWQDCVVFINKSMGVV